MPSGHTLGAPVLGEQISFPINEEGGDTELIDYSSYDTLTSDRHIYMATISDHLEHADGQHDRKRFEDISKDEATANACSENEEQQVARRTRN